MKRTIRIDRRDLALYQDLKARPEILAMQDFTAHRDTSVYWHSISVANLSLLFASRFHMSQKHIRDLILAAMLHDFYLYDYHGRRVRNGWHAWTHPGTALANAMRLFDLSPAARNAIRSHMFPGTLFHMPLHAIGWIVSVTDKICAIFELFGSDRFRSAVLVPV